jgi:16S rRNA (adenine1518-N6/adenine1519-N6)-dimethyltransferase
MPRFDQHFLCSPGIAERIAAEVQPLPEETLLEVGPGHGALTTFLLQKAVPYIGIEIDPTCMEQLQQLPGAEKATWIRRDFLQVPLPTLPLFFVSNLPYSISGPTLFRILEHAPYIRAGVLMLQAEVAQRLYAPAGKRPYGRLSVLFQSVYRVRRLFRVPPGAFSPPPEVQSEVITFTRDPKLPMEAWASFAAFVQAAFQQPRQTLGRNLRRKNLTLPPSWAAKRPHEIDLPTFLQLWQTHWAPSAS